MSNLTSTANLGEYRATQHAWKLNFKRGSVIRRADNNLVPSYVYTFTPPADIWLPTFDANYLVDVIGILTGVGERRPYMKNGIKHSLLPIELTNNGYRFNITIFGSLVEELTSFLTSGDGRNAIVVVTFAKLKNWNGRDTLQSTVNSSQLMINPDLFSDTTLLKNSMSDTLESPSTFLTQLQVGKSATTGEDFLFQTQSATIQQLKSYSQEQTFSCMRPSITLQAMVTGGTLHVSAIKRELNAELCIKESPRMAAIQNQKEFSSREGGFMIKCNLLSIYLYCCYRNNIQLSG